MDGKVINYYEIQVKQGLKIPHKKAERYNDILRLWSLTDFNRMKKW